ncbi:hypothetical protein CSIM01_03030 [Colletotrichum simmondsii]|uniref:Uncharacterized protein n=1 Tax=Colletotrichum simmondsii TaxID=703756 RepID=A0A135SL99_9PEZI|nr:hypothetical protein CSIM01_03030 [Colletotrichum simmondsii]
MPVVAVILSNSKGQWLPTGQHQSQANGNRCIITRHDHQAALVRRASPDLSHVNGQQAVNNGPQGTHQARLGFLCSPVPRSSIPSGLSKGADSRTETEYLTHHLAECLVASFCQPRPSSLPSFRISHLTPVLGLVRLEPLAVRTQKSEATQLAPSTSLAGSYPGLIGQGLAIRKWLASGRHLKNRLLTPARQAMPVMIRPHFQPDPLTAALA